MGAASAVRVGAWIGGTLGFCGTVTVLLFGALMLAGAGAGHGGPVRWLEIGVFATVVGAVVGLVGAGLGAAVGALFGGGGG